MGEVINFLEEKKKRKKLDEWPCPCEGEGLHLSDRILKIAEKLDEETVGQNRKRS